MRMQIDTYYDKMSDNAVKDRLKELNEFDSTSSIEILCDRLKKYEQKRNIILWHDASSLANHGHLVFMVPILYDPAIHLTNEEYREKKTGKTVNIQAIVEKPELYIVARCKSNDEQLAYVETHTVCLKDLDKNWYFNGNEITDRMRFFKGDGPAVEYESGQQIGRYFHCIFGIHSDRVTELDHAFQCPMKTVDERWKTVSEGSVGHQNTLNKKPKPFTNLSKADIELEVLERKLNWRQNMTKSELQFELSQELRGISRVPALFYSTPLETLENRNLQFYDILPSESMHDIAGHISNIFEESPNHIS